MKVSVIILNWNGKKFLKECLESLAAQTYREFETVLVDNGSADGSTEFVRDELPLGAAGGAAGERRLCRRKQPGICGVHGATT